MVIGNKKIKLAFILFLLFCVLVSCGKKQVANTNNDLETIKGFLSFLSDPSTLKIIALEHYKTIGDYDYYRIEWTSPEINNKINNVLLRFQPVIKQTKMIFFSDMDAGFWDDVKPKWDRMQEEGPEKIFSEQEIKELLEKALAEWQSQKQD